MKTITEYQPMIFSRLAAAAEKRSRQRRRRIREGAIVVAYCALGLWLSFDTGLAPWFWQFWLIFAPLFLASELAMHALDAK